MDKFKNYGYIDDERFAENYLTDLLSHHPQGEYMLRKKMRKKGISSEIINSLFAKHVTEEKVQEMSDRLLQKKRSSLERYENYYKKKKKALAYLQRKSFPYRIAINSFDKIFTKD